MKTERPMQSEPSPREIPKWPGVILEGRHIQEEDITYDLLKEARDKKAITKKHFDTLHDRYTKQLELDALTGLSNRRLLKPSFNKLMEEMRREKENREALPLNSIMLVVLDLDKFKEINDAHGHEAGDKALQIIATRIRESFHDTDTVFRIGGDELLIVLPIRSSEPVNYDALFKERRAKILSGLSLGISMGYHVINKEDKTTLEQAVAFADKSMYQEKRNQ